MRTPSTDHVPFMRKAVLLNDETGEEEIVGAGLWKFYTEGENMAGLNGDGTENVVRDPEIETEIEMEMEMKTEGAGKDEIKDSSFWPEGANIPLCEAVFISSDTIRRESMNGKPHALLNILIVSPEHQGRGIGTQLITEGLAEVDRRGITAWLGSTEVALPLYEKVGFVVEKEFVFDMEPYGGTTVERHILMSRPGRVARV